MWGALPGCGCGAGPCGNDPAGGYTGRVKDIARFKKIVQGHYKKHGRKLPWRPRSGVEVRDAGFAYRVFVSEIMLQQTQVDRVIPKYESFLKRFPTFRALARASTADVLREWQGLGYNRRALALKRAAGEVVTHHKGKLPNGYSKLVELPGVGPYTANALRAFVGNEPVVVIETNIRSVFIHHFFPRAKKVADARLVPLIEAAVDGEDPREWYYALMDYGSYLKKNVGNASRRSATHKKQSPFRGSRRQLRGAILRELSIKERTAGYLARTTGRSMAETNGTLRALVREGLVEEQRGGRVRLARG